jgi:hypothetical protein
VNAGWLFINNRTTEIPYCQEGDDKCWLDGWVAAIEDVNGVETGVSASEYIQVVIMYVLWFMALLAVWIIMYAWLVLLTWVWDEEKAKKTKQIILYAVFWLIIIWLAYPISRFVMDWLSTGSNP